MKKKILFIINPVSGVRSKHNIPDKIESHLNRDIFDYEIIYTQGRGHATGLAASAVKQNVDIVAIAGGDGSVNEVANGLKGTETALAIIPMGSGNGLARHLGYSTWVKSTLEVINAHHVKYMDVCKVNNSHFYSLIGVGFDAFVAKVFDKEKTRGLTTYALATIKSLIAYKPFKYKFEAEGYVYEGKSFMINVCNSNQFGYNVKIAPDADVSDGMLNVILVEKFPFWMTPINFFQLVTATHTSGKNKYIKYFKTDKLSIEAPNRAYLQIDGETVHKAKTFDVSLEHKKLKVLVNPKVIA